MKIRLSQLFFVLSQPKLSVHFKILFSLMFLKEVIVIFLMHCFWRNTPAFPSISSIQPIHIVHPHFYPYHSRQRGFKQTLKKKHPPVSFNPPLVWNHPSPLKVILQENIFGTHKKPNS